MGAGGNYAQAAFQALAGEKIKQMSNQPAQPAEVNQELVEQYTPQSTPVGETVEDVTRRFTEGTGAVPTSQSTGLQGILDKIAAEKEALGGLQFSETKTRKVPVYSYYEGQSGTPGLAGSRPGVARTTTELPEGAIYRPASQQGFISTPAGYIGPGGTSYTQQGTRNVTETFTRPAVAGDPEYDKKQKMIDALQGQYDTRSKYASPSATGIQGLIAEPIVNQPQTGYNNINEIMKRYIG
tara:strand:- start:1724 stop:2440 length:717 start_codon:yes stop_codon:yes gene_type:complete